MVHHWDASASGLTRVEVPKSPVIAQFETNLTTSKRTRSGRTSSRSKLAPLCSKHSRNLPNYLQVTTEKLARHTPPWGCTNVYAPTQAQVRSLTWCHLVQAFFSILSLLSQPKEKSWSRLYHGPHINRSNLWVLFKATEANDSVPFSIYIVAALTLMGLILCPNYLRWRRTELAQYLHMHWLPARRPHYWRRGAVAR